MQPVGATELLELELELEGPDELDEDESLLEELEETATICLFLK